MRDWEYLSDLAERLEILNLRKVTNLVKSDDPKKLREAADVMEAMHYELIEDYSE